MKKNRSMVNSCIPEVYSVPAPIEAPHNDCLHTIYSCNTYGLNTDKKHIGIYLEPSL